MSLARLIQPFYWELFSKKLRERSDKMRFIGFFTPQEAQAKQMRLVTGREGDVCLYWLVDESDGVIADAKFQAYGPIGLLIAAEVLSEQVLRKNYDQASRLSAEFIDQQVRDRKEMPAFPKECHSFLNQVLSAVDHAVQQCSDIPFAASHDVTPIDFDWGEIPGGIAGWESFSQEKKLQIIEEVIEKEIRPYVELDAGGVKVVGLNAGREVLIQYEGSCTSCHSSTGSTLTAIQKILRARVHPSLVVIPQ